MASKLVNTFNCIKHCWGVYEQNHIVNSGQPNKGPLLVMTTQMLHFLIHI